MSNEPNDQLLVNDTIQSATPKRKRLRIVKLEDRIVPSHFPAVAQVVVGTPAGEHAPAHAHKVDFAVQARTTAGYTNYCGNT